MALSDHLPKANRQLVRITHVDPAQRNIDAKLKDGALIKVPVHDIPPSFVWPREEEVWSIYRENMIWTLGQKVLDPQKEARVEDMVPGEMRLGGETIKDEQGRRMLTEADIATLIASVAPPGTGRITYVAAEDPGWLLCDGRAVNRTTYAALFAKIGTVHGVGDGLTTFNLPDGKQRIPIGAGSGGTGSDGQLLTTRTIGQKGGRETHNHGQSDKAGGTQAVMISQVQNHMNPFFVVYHMIKT